MTRRIVWIVLAFAVGLVAGHGLPGSGEGSLLGAAPALAGEALSVRDGQVFVTSDGASVYLWKRSGDRVSLIGECIRTEEGSGAATFVWLPGVERES